MSKATFNPNSNPTKKDLDTIETFGRHHKLSAAMDTDTALMQSVQNILKDIAVESIMINKTIPFQVQALSPNSLA